MSGIDFHEFPQGEYHLRWERAQAAMAEAGLDALLISDPSNYRYFSGHCSPTRNRPTFVVLPLAGAPVLLAASYGAHTAGRMTWIETILEYEPPISGAALHKTLAELGLERATIGLESHDRFLGSFRMTLPYGELDALRQAMPAATFIDASTLLWYLRMIKTPGEIDCLRQACSITGHAYECLFAQVTGGMTEKEVAQILITAMMREGADYPSQGRPGPCAFIIVDATRPVGQVHTPTDKVMVRGDLLHIDAGAIYNGYCADFGRSGVVGEISPAQKIQWEALMEQRQQALDMIRPGARLGDIPAHWHGLGLDGVEAPFIDVHDDLPIEAGMALAIEELAYADRGDTYHFEEDIVVTEDGYELLSTTSPELYLIPEA